LLFISCGSGEKRMTREEFCQERATRACTSIAPACLMTEVDCIAADKTGCTLWAEQQETHQPPHSFDSGNAEVCLSRVSAVYGVLKGNLAIGAKDYRSLDEACGRVFHGAAKANEVCAFDDDCTGKLFCDKGRCGTLRQVGPGEGCANIGQTCPQGYACYEATGVWLCTVRPGLGAACSDEFPCLESLRCATEVCVDRLDIGIPCKNDGECASGFCEPYAQKCANDIRFAEGTSVCRLYQTYPTTP
jgi:hypothetical protein